MLTPSSCIVLHRLEENENSVVIFGSYNESRQISAKTLIHCGENTNGEIIYVLVFPECHAECAYILLIITHFQTIRYRTEIFPQVL